MSVCRRVCKEKAEELVITKQVEPTTSTLHATERVRELCALQMAVACIWEKNVTDTAVCY